MAFSAPLSPDHHLIPEAMALEPGTLAPDFSLPSTSGRTFTLHQDVAGQPIVLVFYPRDDSPICTREVCAFRDHFAPFRNARLPVVGISRDDLETHRRFKERHHLPFDLLSDLNGKVCEQYDALVPLLRIPKRITYLLDADHRIKAVYDAPFEAGRHVEEMIAALEELG